MSDLGGLLAPEIAPRSGNFGFRCASGHPYNSIVSGLCHGGMFVKAVFSRARDVPIFEIYAVRTECVRDPPR